MSGAPFNRDRIHLTAIRAFGRHGANAGEKDVPQPFDIEVHLDVDLRAARASDALADTIDYGALHGRIVGIVRERSFDLLERLGDEILAVVLADPRVDAASVRIAKPGLLAGATPAVTVSGQRRARAYIGLGGNVGDVARTMQRAVDACSSLGRVVARSSLYRTPPWGILDQPPFVNAVVALDTALTPEALLFALKRIEHELGRAPSERWGPRAIDLDILDMPGLARDEPLLTIPHARLAERAFALVPLAEIAPDYAALRDALPPADLAAVERIGAFDREGSAR